MLSLTPLLLFAAPVPSTSTACISANTNSIVVALPRFDGAVMTELQFCAGDHCARSHAQTASDAEDFATVIDLEPGSRYTFWSRHLLSRSRTWTALSLVAVCATTKVSPTVVQAVRRVGSSPEPSTIQLSWLEPDALKAVGYAVEYTRISSRSSEPRTVVVHTPSVKLEGLEPGSEYAVRVRAVLAPPPQTPHEGAPSPEEAEWSDATLHRTARPGLLSYNALRVSERCDGDCEPDYLSDHDAAEVQSEATLITLFSLLGENDPLGVRWPRSVITQYCVEQAEDRFGEYLACNGLNSMNYTCTCMLCADTRPARLPLRTECSASASDLSPIQCDLAENKRSVGKLELFWPIWTPPGGRLPAKNESTSLGSWLSYPHEIECAHSAPVGSHGCVWRREPTSAIVRGDELLSAGWHEVRSPTEISLEIVRTNAALLRELLSGKTSRCCGC